MTIDIQNLAVELLNRDDDAYEELMFFEFKDDVEAHNEELQNEQHRYFLEKHGRIAELLTRVLGPPIPNDDLSSIPIGGHFAISSWRQKGKRLFLAAVHEDRECPIGLVMGTVAD